MTTAMPSPKRRHILSSINPERPPITEDRSRSPEPTAPPREPSLHDAYGNGDGDMERPPEQLHPRKTSKFRFKSKHSSSHRSSRHGDKDRDRDRGRDRNLADDAGDGDQEHDDSSSTQRRHHRHRRHRDDHEDDDQQHRPDDTDGGHRHHHHHHHRHKRRRHHRHRTRTRSPTPPNPYDPAPLSPDAAFQASLFDAMADDEGAAYWEAVYGQPMHVYSRGSGSGSGQAPAAGDLEQMDEEEYAAYVRQRMWEKTHEGLLEERARREARKQQRAARETEARRLTREMEESLRRGEERRRRRGWRDRWEKYVGAWAAWDNNHNQNNDNDGDDDDDDDHRRRHPLENDTDMAWPVESGRRADVRHDGEDGSGTDAVREFFVRGLVEAQDEAEEVGEAKTASARNSAAATAAARLKDERVRWHPDKVQQRLGGRVDDGLMRDVTAVFQAVDKLWSDMRSKKDA